jgi:hypothetical protein
MNRNLLGRRRSSWPPASLNGAGRRSVVKDNTYPEFTPCWLTRLRYLLQISRREQTLPAFAHFDANHLPYRRRRQCRRCLNGTPA